MSNKTLALFGIVSYILSVYASETNSEGVSTIPEYIIISSGTISVIYTIIATIRLWKYWKFLSILFGVSSFFYFGMELLKVILKPAYGTTLLIIVNITMVVDFLLYFYVIFFFFRIKKYQSL